MKLRIAKLRYRMLTLGWLLAVAIVFAALLLNVLTVRFGPAVQWLQVSMMAGAALLLLVILWRIARFRGRAYTFLRHLVAGDYETGLPESQRWQDEITELEAMFNKLVARLREYDELRTRRIRQLRMTLNLVLDHTEQPMALYDVEKGTFDFNAVMSGMLDAPKQTVALRTLENIEQNKPFLEMLIRAIEEEKSEQEGRVTIQFPGHETPREASVRIVPFKDKDERVPLAVILGTLASQ